MTSIPSSASGGKPKHQWESIAKHEPKDELEGIETPQKLKDHLREQDEVAKDEEKNNNDGNLGDQQQM